MGVRFLIFQISQTLNFSIFPFFNFFILPHVHPRPPSRQKLSSESHSGKTYLHSTGISKAELFTKADQPLEEEQKNRIQRAYSQYTKEKKPLEYIL